MGINKSAIKAKIKEVKKMRDEAFKARDHGQLKTAQRKIHKLKRTLRRSMV
jgi:hypothetical protein